MGALHSLPPHLSGEHAAILLRYLPPGWIRFRRRRLATEEQELLSTLLVDKRFEAHRCFDNVRKLLAASDDDRLAYCEGFLVWPDDRFVGGTIALHHAWMVVNGAVCELSVNLPNGERPAGYFPHNWHYVGTSVTREALSLSTRGAHFGGLPMAVPAPKTVAWLIRDAVEEHPDWPVHMAIASALNDLDMDRKTFVGIYGYPQQFLTLSRKRQRRAE
jgi:hypothetical protein